MSKAYNNLHVVALKRFDVIQSAMRDERLQCLQDRRFYSVAGAQWEGSLYDMYENKPKFEVNKIHIAILKIISEYRNNKIDVKFSAKDNIPDQSVASFCNDLFRADQKYSNANEAYDNAFEEAVGGGFGAVRLRNIYVNEDSEDDDEQKIVIEPIFDADSSVFFDLNSKRQDKADANFCFVLSSMSHDSFMDEYGVSPASFNKEIFQYEFDWQTPDVVYIAEYYFLEKVKYNLHVFRAIDGSEEVYSDDDLENESLQSMLNSSGYQKIRIKKIIKKKVRKLILSGNAILEDCGYIAGDKIPIVPVYGKRWFVDNIERCMGHVRLAKDAQRLKNMQISKLGEISALSSIEKPIFMPEQVSGFQLLWSEDNVKNYPYMLINPLQATDGQKVFSGPVAYTRPPAIPPAMAALLQITDQDIKEILGNHQDGEKMLSNISGRAVELIQSKLDMQTYIYISNFAKALQRVGEVWLGMAKDVYVEHDRNVIGVRENTSVIDKYVLGDSKINKNGEMYSLADFSKYNFDVVVEVGPSTASKKDALLKNILEMMRVVQDPESIQVLSSLAMMYMDGDNFSDVKEYYRKRLVAIGVIAPSDQELQQMAKASPDGKTSMLEDALSQQAMAQASKDRISTMKIAAETELTKAKTADILYNIKDENF
jgi:hypothetical protein